MKTNIEIDRAYERGIEQENENEAIQSDEAEREQALDPYQSFIVQAPAGSGKTELLIQRYLTLLCHVDAPEEILAITFTKKAANEMRTRVIQALANAHLVLSRVDNQAKENRNQIKTALIAMNVLKRDEERNWQLQLNPNRLRIQTIDALCVYLTKSLPIISGFGSQPQISDFPEQLYREAVQSVLAHLEDDSIAWSKDIALLLEHLDNDINKLHNLLVSLLAKRDQWMQYIHWETSSNAPTNTSTIQSILEQHLRLVIANRLQALKEVLRRSDLHELLAIMRFAGATDERAAPDTTHHQLNQWQVIARFLLTKQFTWRKRAGKEIGFPAKSNLKNAAEKAALHAFQERYAQLILSMQDNQLLRQLLEETLLLPQAQFNPAQWRILMSLFHVLKIVVAQLRLTFQTHGCIDFIENAQAALTALGDEDKPTDLLLALDYNIKHILIDEFQDTSSTQFNLLKKLICGWQIDDGRTLFVVGDPMQSIYRFREAEVGLFIRMCTQGIGQINLTPLTLQANFRSAPIIVDWNNRHFQPIFPTEDDVATGAVKYSMSIAKRAQTQTSMTSALANVHIKGFKTDDDHQQADDIVRVVGESLLQYPQETIAILVRSRTHLTHIIAALKAANIAFQAIDIEALSARAHIQDLLSLTCALLHSADRIAWLAILRAPWCGLQLKDIFVIANQPSISIWQQLMNHDVLTQLSNDGQTRVAKLIDIIKTQLNNRERTDLRTWIETTWQLLGGPATLQNEGELQDAQAFFALLSTFANENVHLNVDLLKEKINTFYASNHPEADCRLQIMTIHSAKGLEFDTVIIPHLERKIPQDDKPLLNWMERPLNEDDNALLIAPFASNDEDNQDDRLYHYIQQQKKIKTRFEADRLFYVATTRAKNNLFLYFNVEFKGDDAAIASNTFLEKLWPFIANQVTLLQDADSSSKLNSNSNSNSNGEAMLTATAHHGGQGVKRLPLEWKNVIHGFQQPIFYHKQQAGFILRDMQAQTIGVVVHGVLQNLANYGLAWWQQHSAERKTLYLARLMKQAGILGDQLHGASQSAVCMIERCIADTKGQWILHPHLEAQSEYALTALLDGKIKHIVIDRTFIDENGIRWIIDFKTAKPAENQSIEVFLQTQYEKYKDQLELYERVFKQKNEMRPIRLGLYFPAIPAWIS